MSRMLSSGGRLVPLDDVGDDTGLRDHRDVRHVVGLDLRHDDLVDVVDLLPVHRDALRLRQRRQPGLQAVDDGLVHARPDRDGRPARLAGRAAAPAAATLLLSATSRHAVVMAMVTPTTANVLNREGPRIGAPSWLCGSMIPFERAPPVAGQERQRRRQVMAARTAACSRGTDPSRRRYRAVTHPVAVRVLGARGEGRTAGDGRRAPPAARDEPHAHLLVDGPSRGPMLRYGTGTRTLGEDLHRRHVMTTGRAYRHRNP